MQLFIEKEGLFVCFVFFFWNTMVFVLLELIGMCHCISPELPGGLVGLSLLVTEVGGHPHTAGTSPQCHVESVLVLRRILELPPVH